jgi:hypothetical protein
MDAVSCLKMQVKGFEFTDVAAHASPGIYSNNDSPLENEA